VVPMEYDSKASAPNATQPCIQSLLISLLDRLVVFNLGMRAYVQIVLMNLICLCRRSLSCFSTLAVRVADPAGFWVVPGLPQIPGDQGNGAL
jgi:hypothetical protein